MPLPKIALSLCLGLVLSATGITNAIAYAQSLVVLDCQGFTRAAQKTDPGLKSKVQVKVSSTGTPADGAHVQLTNVATSDVVSVVSEQGLATFENLPSGTYVLKVAESNLVIETVTVGSMGVGAIAAGGALLGAGLGGGAAVTGVVAGTSDLVDNIGGNNGGTSGNNGNGGEDNSGTPTPAPTVPTAEPTPRAPAPTPTPCPACDPEANPPSLDDQNDFMAAPGKVLSPIE